jgi:TIR domain
MPDSTVVLLIPSNAHGEQVRLQLVEPVAAANTSGINLITVRPVDPATIDAALKVIASADAVIAEVSTNDPDVMLVLGCAVALKRPILPIMNGGSTVPFSLTGVRVFTYRLESENWGSSLRFLGYMLIELLQRPSEFSLGSVARGKHSSARVFISYAHQDEAHLNRLLVHLKPLERDGRLELWSDLKLQAGDQWRSSLQTAVERCTAAVLMVSADFIASDFISTDELPPLLLKAREGGARILPVVIGHCRYLRDPSLSGFQAVNDPSRPLAVQSAEERERVYDSVALELERWVEATRAKP